MKTNEIIHEILGRELSYFDYKSRDKGYWQRYFNDAKLIVESDVFQNELSNYVNDLTKFCATMQGYPPTQEKLQILTNVQFGIVVLEDFVNRLKAIEDPRKTETRETINEAI